MRRTLGALIGFILALLSCSTVHAAESRTKLILTYGLARAVPTALTELALADPHALEGNPLMGKRSVRLGVNGIGVLLLTEGTYAMSKAHPNRAKWFKRAVVLLCIADSANNLIALRKLKRIN